MHRKYFHPLKNKHIRINDPLFGYYSNMIADTVLQYQWDILNDRIEGVELSHCVENFRIAAGLSDGKYYGTVNLDSDIYKWLEAVSYCIESGKRNHLNNIADEAIDLISKAQQPDGYLNTYYTVEKPEERWTNLVEGLELYSAGHLIEAAVAHYSATDKTVLLDTAIRFADLITETFGPGSSQIQGYPGHQEIELALVKLYRLTGEKRYLDTARYFIDYRGVLPNYFLGEIDRRNEETIFPEFKNYDLKYSQSHKPPVSQKSIGGHAVRAMYMCSAMADLALEYGDEELTAACSSLWASTTEKNMFITGGLGSSGFLERFTTEYDLPNDSMYCETCASVGLMMFGQRMASVTKDAGYYDAVERALYNTVMAGINADGLKYFYVNPLEVWPDRCLPSTSMRHVRPVRQKWYSCACCPTNIARTLASLGQYIYAADDRSLYIHLFISSEVVVEEFGGVRVKMVADIAAGGIIRITADAPVNLRIRIPDYSEEPEFLLDADLAEPVIESGYAFFELKSAAEIKINFNVKPRWTAANNRVRSDAGKAALIFGPFVYCLEETDNGSNLSAAVIDTDVSVERGKRLSELPGNMPVFEYDGYRMDSGVSGLYGTADFRMEPIRLHAVPYCLWCNREPGEMIIWQRVRI